MYTRSITWAVLIVTTCIPLQADAWGPTRGKALSSFCRFLKQNKNAPVKKKYCETTVRLETIHRDARNGLASVVAAMAVMPLTVPLVHWFTSIPEPGLAQAIGTPTMILAVTVSELALGRIHRRGVEEAAAETLVAKHGLQVPRDATTYLRDRFRVRDGQNEKKRRALERRLDSTTKADSCSVFGNPFKDRRTRLTEKLGSLNRRLRDDRSILRELERLVPGEE